MMKKLDALFGENTFIKMIPPSGNRVLFGVFSTTAAGPEEMFVKLRGIGGVTNVISKVMQEVVEHTGLIERRIDEKMHEAKKNRE